MSSLSITIFCLATTHFCLSYIALLLLTKTKHLTDIYYLFIYLFCLHNFSEDMPDVTASHNHHPTGLLHVVTLNKEYIEDAWQTHTKNFIEDVNPIESVKSFVLFRRLFKVEKMINSELF